MEALAAVSLAGNILQFIDFTSRLVSKGREIHTQGSLSEHSDLENVTTRLVEFNLELRESLKSKKSSTEGLTKNEKVSFHHAGPAIAYAGRRPLRQSR